jgi:hypothetical protein
MASLKISGLMVKRANSKFAEMTLMVKVPFGSWSPFLGGACVVLISVRAGGSAGCSCVWVDWTMSSTFSSVFFLFFKK